MDDASAKRSTDGKLLGLGYPGGPQVRKEAMQVIRTGSHCRARCMDGRGRFLSFRAEDRLRLEAEKIAPLSDQGRGRISGASSSRRWWMLSPTGCARALAFSRQVPARRQHLWPPAAVAANQAIRKILHRLAFDANGAGRSAAGIMHRITAR